MYFWRIEELKSKLAVAALTDREVLPYFVVFIALTTSVSVLPSERMNHWDYFYGVSSVLISIFGTLYLYRRNGGHKGAYFLQRYVAVGWVVAVRWIAFFIPSFVAFFSVVGWPEEANALNFGFNVIAILAFYQRLGHHMADIASHTSAV